MTVVDNFIKHLSEQPWSNYTKADYSLEQWHEACLIHQHEGSPTSKSQCKIPVKTPNGVVSRNGVHAAAAALAGARGGVDASAEEKASAANALVRLYRQMDEKPPPSLLSHSQFLQHYGKKGMKWGSRKSTASLPKSREHRQSAELRKRKASQLTNKQLKDVNARINLEQNYNRMNPTTLKKGLAAVAGILALAKTVNEVAKLPENKAVKAIIAANKKKKAAGKIMGKVVFEGPNKSFT